MEVPLVNEMFEKVWVPVKVVEVFWKQVPLMARQPLVRLRPLAKVEEAVVE